MSNQLSPELKAKELFSRFRNLEDGDSCISNNRNSKECAFIACDVAIAERKRAVEIAYEFRDKHLQTHEARLSAKSEIAFVSKDIAEECRYIGNAISGHNALSVALNEKNYWGKVKEEIKKL